MAKKNDWVLPVVAVVGLASVVAFIFQDSLRWILFKENAPGSGPIPGRIRPSPI